MPTERSANDGFSIDTPVMVADCSKTPSWQLLIDAIAGEPDQRRRRNLELVAGHVVAEVNGDLEALMATMVDEPTYHVWGASDTPGPQGSAEVRAFYQGMIRTGKNRLEFEIGRVIVDDRHVVTEGEMRHAYEAATLLERKLDAGGPVVPGAWYLVAYRVLIVWPVSDGGLLEGEDIFAGEVPRVVRRLAAGEMPHLGLEGR